MAQNRTGSFSTDSQSVFSKPSREYALVSSSSRSLPGTPTDL